MSSSEKSGAMLPQGQPVRTQEKVPHTFTRTTAVASIVAVLLAFVGASMAIVASYYRSSIASPYAFGIAIIAGGAAVCVNLWLVSKTVRDPDATHESTSPPPSEPPK